jgi:hypothetical protein
VEEHFTEVLKQAGRLALGKQLYLVAQSVLLLCCTSTAHIGTSLHCWHTSAQRQALYREIITFQFC